MGVSANRRSCELTAFIEGLYGRVVYHFSSVDCVCVGDVIRVVQMCCVDTATAVHGGDVLVARQRHSHE